MINQRRPTYLDREPVQTTGTTSVPDGIIKVEWWIEQERFCLSWREEGGPPARASTRTGFGSRLIGMSIAGARKAELDYSEEGLRAVFRCPRMSLEQD